MTNTTPTAVVTSFGILEHIDPNLLVVESNVRSEAKLQPEFLASIKQNGVLTPILARQDEQGTIIVRAGQRRTLAARQGGLETIPVYITDASDTTVERIVQQMAENEHRDAVTDTDRAAAYQQLAFEGLTPAVIAKRLNITQAIVKTGIAVAENTIATSALVSHALTLDQAAALIEFESDDDTVTALIEEAVTNPGGFDHAAQRARDERTRASAIATVVIDMTDRGFVVLERQPSSWQADDHTRISDLITADGIPVTAENSETVDGRAVYIDTDWDGNVRVLHYLPTNALTAAGFTKVNGAGSHSGPMTEEQKAERKTLIANNKAWASAEVVRRDWLGTFLSRKTLPKDAAQFIAQGLTVHGLNVGSATRDGNTLAHTLMGVARGGYFDRDKLSNIVEATPSKAQHVTLAVVLGGIEAHTSKITWRSPGYRDSLYFTQLTVWGYTLSDVEQIVVDHESKHTAAPLDHTDVTATQEHNGQE